MPEKDFFEKMGLYLDPDFLETDLCIEICESIRKSNQVQSPLSGFSLGKSTGQGSARPKVVVEREGRYVEIVRDKLDALMTDLNEFFQVELGSVQMPYFGIYNEGDLMKKHIDVVGTGKTNEFGPNRVVTIIIYLNDESEETSGHTYGGGSLTFHDLLKNPGFEKYGYPIKGEAGKLLAFPSTFMHEVTPVTHGTRYVVSSGYY